MFILIFSNAFKILVVFILIHFRLCSQDPHQLFLRLESQIRDIMVEVKTSLLVRLKENGIATPELALDFTRTLLSHYDLLTKKAHLFAQYLGDLVSFL